MSVKLAIISLLAVILTVPVVPVKLLRPSPVYPVNEYPAAGVAVSRTLVPSRYVVSCGLWATVPEPAGFGVTVNVQRGTKFAVTVFEAVIAVDWLVPAPVTAPVHPVKSYPAGTFSTEKFAVAPGPYEKSKLFDGELFDGDGVPFAAKVVLGTMMFEFMFSVTGEGANAAARTVF